MTTSSVQPGLVVDMPIIAQSAVWTLYREPAVQLLVLHGDVDDAASDAWRAESKKDFDTAGFPRTAFVSPMYGNAVSSLPARMRTAMYLRFTAQHVERVVVVTSRQNTFVIKTLLRAAGASNVELVSEADAASCLARCRGRS